MKIGFVQIMQKVKIYQNKLRVGCKKTLMSLIAK